MFFLIVDKLTSKEAVFGVCLPVIAHLAYPKCSLYINAVMWQARHAFRCVSPRLRKPFACLFAKVVKKIAIALVFRNYYRAGK